MQIDLCWLGAAPPPWSRGSVVTALPSPEGVAAAMTRQAASTAEGTLFWSEQLGPPPAAMELTADVMHAGLMLGAASLPRSNDFVTGTWMWNADPPRDRAATSWRLTLDACAIRTDVLRQLGGCRPEFHTLLGAGLELGQRYLTRGAFVRYEPSLCRSSRAPEPLPLHDDLLFAQLRFGPFWARWALGRGLLDGSYALRDVLGAREAFAVVPPSVPHFARVIAPVAPDPSATVSVILPTIERYPYLRTLLSQLAAQTYPVHEILIVDQTPRASRERDLVAEFPQLPIRVIEQDVAGQCTARNAALDVATGDFALFIDDDDEVDPDLVARHLTTLATYGVDVSSGVANEVGAGPVPESHSFLRLSDVFPTNNTMIRRRVLAASGMFDLAYDRKMIEDGDLGTRLYLAGVKMILDPSIVVLHHHAPRGGLRTHGARAVTYASSRKRITHRNLPHAAEVYYGMRYYTPSQVDEMLAQRAWGTLAGRGSLWHRGLKIGYGLVKMPDTLRHIRAARIAAAEMLAAYPKIPPLSSV